MKNNLSKFVRYLEVERGCSKGTIGVYGQQMEKELIPFLHQRGRSAMGEVTRDDIRGYLDFLAFERGNSGVTRRRKLAAIRSFFNYLVDSEGLKANPAAGIKSPAVSEREPVCLTDEECRRLLQTVAREAKPAIRERDTAILVLFLHAGLRVSELIHLRLMDANLKERQIRVTRKGDKEQSLPLNGEVARVVGKYLARQQKTGPEPLFTGSKGQRLERGYVYGMVRKYLCLAGINKAKHGPHILRHTFCTRLHQKGVDPFVIARLAGHKSLSTTMRYIRIEDREQAQAVGQLEFGSTP
ncbi:tyrosine-type recombinase/integrase [Dehalococcoidia bacterium]|nr:tyrosine-type recombinase/integrase [Dehalococcoidia bacterium]